MLTYYMGMIIHLKPRFTSKIDGEFPVSYSQLRLDALERLPDDFPNLAAIRSIWKQRDEFTLTNEKYIEKCKKEIDEEIERYLKSYKPK